MSWESNTFNRRPPTMTQKKEKKKRTKQINRSISNFGRMFPPRRFLDCPKHWLKPPKDQDSIAERMKNLIYNTIEDVTSPQWTATGKGNIDDIIETRIEAVLHERKEVLEEDYSEDVLLGRGYESSDEESPPPPSSGLGQLVKLSLIHI